MPLTQGNSIGISEAATPKKESATELEIGLLQNQIKSLLNYVSLLNSRLSSVLRSKLDEPVENSKDLSLPPLPEAIKKCRDEVAFANKQLADILEKLEL